jgi:hypothetical protein
VARAHGTPRDPRRQRARRGDHDHAPNVGALGAWVAVAASTWPQIELAEAVVLGACVGIGSAAWFALLARFVGAKRERPWMRHVPRIALVLLIAMAVTGVFRAL